MVNYWDNVEWLIERACVDKVLLLSYDSTKKLKLSVDIKLLVTIEGISPFNNTYMNTLITTITGVKIFMIRRW